MSADKTERRRGLRVPAILPTEVHWSGEQLLTYSTDVSKTGAFLRNALQIPVGESIQIAFELPPREEAPSDAEVRRVVATGLVTRHLGPGGAARSGYLPGLGVQFEEVREGLDYLWSYLEELRARIRFEKALTHDGQKLKDPSALPLFWGRDPSLSELGHLHFSREAGSYLIEAEEPAPPGTHVYLWFQVPGLEGPQPARATADVKSLAAFGTHGFACMALGKQLSTRERDLLEDYFGTGEVDEHGRDTGSHRALDKLMVQAMKESRESDNAQPVSAPVAESSGQRLLVSAVVGTICAVIAAIVMVSLMS